jgi:uncharacterized repeat protein (TIGR01451 family)
VAGLMIAVAAPSFAVHNTGMFELEGNIAHNAGSTPPYDWASLFDASGSPTMTADPINGPLLASTFVHDSAVPDQSYFTSNKDIQPIASGQQHWGCDPVNNPLDKDDLLNAYAALVRIPANAPDNAGHTVLYLGSERGSNNGTSFAGFWLMKNSNVGCSGSNDFSGQHTDGDLLVVSDYTNGGGTQDVSVYRWNGNDATGSLSAAPIIDGAICGGAANDNACAIANAASITSPWSPTSHDSDTFVETGIDMNVLLGQAGGCFTTFLAETRSSAELTATLKDFAGGQFNTCVKPPMTTTATPGGSENAPGAAQHDVATVDAVANNGTPTGTVNFFLCGPSDVTAAGCPTGGTHVGGDVTLAGGSATSATISGATDTALGKYCWRAEYTPDAAASGSYLGNSHTNATTECFTVVHGSPTITTQIDVGGQSPPGLGLTTLGDAATLHGAIGSTDGETITFKLYGPYVGMTPDCLAAQLIPAATTTGTLSGGVAHTSASYSPTAAGTYVWIASYPGDTLNDAVTGQCSDGNEKATIVGAIVDVSKSSNPPGPVDAGDVIGFDITVTNTGSVPATGVHVTDNLPAGADLNWSLDPAFAGCAITGAVGAQVLNCDLGTVAGGASVGPIHVSATTTTADCGVVSNKATVTTTNGTGHDSDLASVTVRCATLHLTKTADAASVSAGSQIGFTVTATNTGAGTAHGVTISDPLPTGTGVSWSISPATPGCSITANVLNCTVGDLSGPNGSFSVHVVSPTTFASCATYPNTASLTSTNAPSLTADASTTVLCPNVSLTKTADADSVDAGSDIGFTVTAHNAGPGTATGVTINDPLPSGTGISWSISPATAGCSITGAVPAQVLVCGPTPLASGADLTVHVTSATTSASCKAYDNTASVTVTNEPNVHGDSATTTVQCAALTLTKTEDAATVVAGSPIGFTIIASNTGTGTAHSATISDPLPTGSGVSWSISPPTAGCSITANVLTCNLGDFGPGDHVTVHVVSGTSFASCAVYPNVATLTSSNAPTLQANASTTVLCPNVSLVKTADAATVNAGEQVGFTVTASNSGGGTAVGVLINDPLPSGTGVSWSISPATAGCSITGAPPAQVLTCGPVDLAPDAHLTVHVISQTTEVSCGAYDNTASVTVVNEPNVPGDSATTTVQCPALSFVKVADDATVSAGSDIGFTLTGSNSSAAGTGTASGVELNDVLPTGTGVSWTIESQSPAGACSITNGILTCHVASLAPGASLVVHVTSPTVFASCKAYPNTALLDATNAAPIEASATTTVLCPDVVLVKTPDSLVPVDAGSDIGFTVTATNNGDGQATGVVINDPLPAGEGVDWQLDPAAPANCAITGAAPAQVLVCAAVDLDAGGASETVHVTSGTSFVSCGLYDNTASVTVANEPDVDPATADTTVLCSDLTLLKTPDADLVNAGDQIGFTVTVSNADEQGTGTAHGVVLNDPLPTGSPDSGVSWTIESESIEGACAITDGTLACEVGDLGPADSFSVHVVSSTEFASCGVYPNEATLTAINAPGGIADASTTVQCPAASLIKVADADTVTAGEQIGFTVTASNGEAEGTGTATGVVIDDPLPAGPDGSGIDWQLDDTAPENCTISEAPQTLICTEVDLAAGASESVHVFSDTTEAACAVYDNTASLTVLNAPDIPDASASTTVICPGTTPVQNPPPTPAPGHSPAQGTSSQLAATGNTALPAQLGWAVGLVTLGGLLLAFGARRRREY